MLVIYEEMEDYFKVTFHFNYYFGNYRTIVGILNKKKCIVCSFSFGVR